MIAARQHAHDPISFVAIALPVSAVILHLAATFLVPSSLGGISTALIAASFLIVFASGPFAGVVALRARQINERRMRRALLGLALGVGFSVLFVYGTWLVQSRTRDAQGCLETQAEQAMNGTPHSPCVHDVFSSIRPNSRSTFVPASENAMFEGADGKVTSSSRSAFGRSGGQGCGSLQVEFRLSLLPWMVYTFAQHQHVKNVEYRYLLHSTDGQA